ncbi:hypothetical protein MMC16_002168 [Acarospora aff. strigata]|nr:hypothetical protein [Acarospora aff. strigata]
MLGLKQLLTLGLGCLAVWGTPIAPVSDNKRSIEDKSAAALERRVVPPVITVAPWEDGLGAGTFKKATYVAQMSTGILGAPTHADVAEYARKAFENMMEQKHPQKNTHLMAALFIPTTRSIYLSSVPDGPGIGRIKEEGAEKAPAWWSQVNNRQPTLALHAEDGAAFFYEKSLGNKFAAGAPYPAGSFIAVYGFINNQPKGPARLCAGAGTRPLNPSCDTVFTNLGVGF